MLRNVRSMYGDMRRSRVVNNKIIWIEFINKRLSGIKYDRIHFIKIHFLFHLI